MKYRSTRSDGEDKFFSFTDAVLSGSGDSGLLVPVAIPRVSRETWGKWKSLKYTDLCFEILRMYIDRDEIPDIDLQQLISHSYQNFRHEEITPVSRLDFHSGTTQRGGDGIARDADVQQAWGGGVPYYLLEMYHGPTYAFKDVALQLLGRTFEYLLRNGKKHMVILAATSGDTGSAAIAGFRNTKMASTVVLFPKGRTSRIQQLQMTTNKEAKDHCIAVASTFDRCQSMVKECLLWELRDSLGISVVNSINWMRILAQMVYYWYSCFRVLEAEPDSTVVDFAVPTGNFGNILAGYYAKSMGAPIGNLIVSTNANNILEHCVNTGEYAVSEAKSTISPAMDIQVSSNFERFVYDIVGGDTNEIRALFALLGETNRFQLNKTALRKTQSEFRAFSASDDECRELLKEVYNDCHRILDPHTAVGVVCARKFRRKIEPSATNEKGAPIHNPCVCAATAHYGKFVETVEEVLGKEVTVQDMPCELIALEKLPQTFVDLPPDVNELKKYLIRHFGMQKGEANEGARIYLPSRLVVAVNRSLFSLYPARFSWINIGLSFLGVALAVGLVARFARKTA